MSFDIKLPNISAPTASGQIEQIRGYLHQLVDQLNFALNSISGGSGELQAVVRSTSSQTQVTEQETQATFNSIKSLIIRSADIINAFEEEITKRYAGKYVAQSDYGTYLELTEQSITTNSKAIESLFKNVQYIITDLENLEAKTIDVTANIRSGLLRYDDAGIPIYGLEIGQVNNVDGEEVFNKFAQFTSDRLTFYDKNDTEVAYISDYKLYITNAQITGTLTLGRYVIDTSDGLSIKWV